MGLIQEFKDFAVKGNVVDMAVGVVMGAAFGTIVNSFVNDIIMPPIGMLIGDVNFSDLKVILSPAVMNGTEVVKPEAAIAYGTFIQTILSFLIIALSIFFVVKGINRLKKKEEAAPAAPSEEVTLLKEIRDELRKK